MVDTRALDDWFVREVLPLEGSLLRFLRRHWRHEPDLGDLRQEVYARVYAAARSGLPAQTKAFVFTSARNLLIDQVRRAQVVSLETVADMDASQHAVDPFTPERHASARDEVRRFQAGLARLPPRCREVVELRKIHGLPQREVAARMGIGEDAVERQTLLGMRALADWMLGGSGRIRRPAARPLGESRRP